MLQASVEGRHRSRENIVIVYNIIPTALPSLVYQSRVCRSGGVLTDWVQELWIPLSTIFAYTYSFLLLLFIETVPLCATNCLSYGTIDIKYTLTFGDIRSFPPPASHRRCYSFSSGSGVLSV